MPNTMSHVGLEADYSVTPEQLQALSSRWHYGWSWKGPEPEGTSLRGAGGQPLVDTMCLCHRAPCGLVVVVEPMCFTHRECKIGAAKQLHKAIDCPGRSE